MPPSRVRIPPSPLRTSERCPSGLRSATGNRVRAERCVAGSNPALSVAGAAGSQHPAVSASVVDPGEQLDAAHDLLRRATEPNLVTGIAREEHLVAGDDAFDLGA